jgi:hypothetical protein
MDTVKMPANKCRHGCHLPSDDAAAGRKNSACSCCTPILIPKGTDPEKIIVLARPSKRWRNLEDMQEKDSIWCSSEAILDAVPTPEPAYVLVERKTEAA